MSHLPAVAGREEPEDEDEAGGEGEGEEGDDCKPHRAKQALLLARAPVGLGTASLSFKIVLCIITLKVWMPLTACVPYDPKTWRHIL